MRPQVLLFEKRRESALLVQAEKTKTSKRQTECAAVESQRSLADSADCKHDTPPSPCHCNNNAIRGPREERNDEGNERDENLTRCVESVLNSEDSISSLVLVVRQISRFEPVKSSKNCHNSCRRTKPRREKDQSK
jgi:hypothetical protein